MEFLDDELTQGLYERRQEEIARSVGPSLYLDECDAFVAMLPLLELREAPQALQRIQVLEARTPHAKARYEASVGKVLVVLAELLSGRKDIATASAQVLTRFAQQDDGWVGALFTRYDAMNLVNSAVAHVVNNIKSNDVDGDGRISSAEYERARASSNAACDVVALMELVQVLAIHRENALSLTRANVPNLLVEVVSRVVDFRKDEIRFMVQILWSVLEHSSERLDGCVAGTRMQLLDKFRHANALCRLGNLSAISMLCSLLERMLLEGHRLDDKRLRNEVLIIATQLASRAPNRALFKSSGLLSLVLLYASAAENELPTGCDTRHFATADPLDMEFKLLTWYAVRYLANSDECRPVINEALYMETLRGYIVPDPLPQRIKGSPYSLSQRCLLRTHALRILASLGPVKEDQEAVLEVLRCTVSNQTGEDRTSDGKAQEISREKLIVDCLQILLHCKEMPDNLSVVANILVRLVCTSNSMSVRESAALALTRMGVAVSQFLRECNGIHAVSNVLLSPNRNDLHHQETCVIAGLACAHACIIDDPLSERLFIDDADGIERLLDLIDGSVIQVQAQALALLADLLANNAYAVPIVMHYKSTASKTDAISLILDLWVSGSCTDALITDLQKPLQEPGCSQQGSSGPRTRLLQALRDAQALMLAQDQRQVLSAGESIDIRERIFAIFDSLTLEDYPQVIDELSNQRRVILVLAQQYKAFREGEQWFKLQEKLSEARVRPIYYDRVVIDKKINDAVERADSARKAQLLYCEAEEKLLESQDREFYNGIEIKQRQRLALMQLKAASAGKMTKS